MGNEVFVTRELGLVEQVQASTATVNVGSQVTQLEIGNVKMSNAMVAKDLTRDSQNLLGKRVLNLLILWWSEDGEAVACRREVELMLC